jgi:Holliday junction DNA helicase RuvB
LTTDFDKNAVRPTGLDEFCGQENLRRRLMPFIIEARYNKSPLPHMLLSGLSGMGKTSLAHSIAAELGDPLHVVDFSRMTAARILSFFRRFEGGIVFVDEAHEMSVAQQDLLLTVMEEGYVPTPGGGKFYVPFVTFIVATDRPQKLNRAFLGRCAVKLEIEPYTDAEIGQMIGQMRTKLGLDMSDDVARALGVAAGGNPRLARDLVMAYKAAIYTVLEDEDRADAAMDICGVQKDGLTDRHLKYLWVLDALDGLAGERNIASLMGLQVAQLMDIEKVLIERGFMQITKVGRCLTAEGDERLHGEKPTTMNRRAS